RQGILEDRVGVTLTNIARNADQVVRYAKGRDDAGHACTVLPPPAGGLPDTRDGREPVEEVPEESRARHVVQRGPRDLLGCQHLLEVLLTVRPPDGLHSD